MTRNLVEMSADKMSVNKYHAKTGPDYNPIVWQGPTT